uniref:Uncharacterized protein n=1 Tax=Amphimedon queenslandica TaxID=400682 RepID=A0A1X7V2X2_AMPQE
MATVQCAAKPKTKKRKKKVAVKKPEIDEDLSLDDKEQPLPDEEEVKIPVVSLSEVLKHDDLEVSDVKGIEEELLNKNEESEERPDSSEDLDHKINHEENERTNEGLKDKRIDEINEEKEEAPVTTTDEVDVDSHHDSNDKEISVDAAMEETTLIDKAKADSNNEKPISVDVIKEETTLTDEAKADSNNEKLISVDAIKEKTTLKDEAKVDSNTEKLISVDAKKEETLPTIEAITSLDNEKLISVDVDHVVTEEMSLTNQANADHSHAEEMIKEEVIMETSLMNQASAGLYHHSHNEELMKSDVVMEASFMNQATADLCYHSYNEEMIEGQVITEMPQASADLYYYPLENQTSYYPLENQTSFYPPANQTSYYPLTQANADLYYQSHNEKMMQRDVVMEMPPTNQSNANNLQQVSLTKKKDKSDPMHYLPSDSFYDSYRYKCCKASCCCDCPTCLDCAACCSCSAFKDWKIKDSETLKAARLDGAITIAKAVLENIYNPVIREIIVYLGFIFLLYSLVESSLGLAEGLQSDERQLGKTLNFIDFGLSMFGLPFTIIDSFIRLRHNGCRVFKRLCKREALVQKDDEDNAECCNDSCACDGTCGKSCVIVMDIVRIVVLEIIFYPELIAQMFQFITLLVDNNYDPKMIAVFDWFNALKGLSGILIFVYLQKGYFLIRIIFSIRIINKEKKWNSDLLIIFFVFYMYGLMILQILMIVIIAERFRYEYTNNFGPLEMSIQLWYMMIFTFLMPFIGIFMFFFAHHSWTRTLPVTVIYEIFKILQTEGEGSKQLESFIGIIPYLKKRAWLFTTNQFKSEYQELKNVSFWNKFIQPFISPLHIAVLFGYFLLFSGFFLSSTLIGPFGKWQSGMYIGAGALAILLNIYATSVTIVWLFILATIILTIVALIAFSIAIIAIVFLGLFLLFICSCMGSNNNK